MELPGTPYSSSLSLVLLGTSGFIGYIFQNSSSRILVGLMSWGKCVRGRLVGSTLALSVAAGLKPATDR